MHAPMSIINRWRINRITERIVGLEEACPILKQVMEKTFDPHSVHTYVMCKRDLAILKHRLGRLSK